VVVGWRSSDGPPGGQCLDTLCHGKSAVGQNRAVGAGPGPPGDQNSIGNDDDDTRAVASA